MGCVKRLTHPDKVLNPEQLNHRYYAQFPTGRNWELRLYGLEPRYGPEPALALLSQIQLLGHAGAGVHQAVHDARDGEHAAHDR
jgi:hypothetical protein